MSRVTTADGLDPFFALAKATGVIFYHCGRLDEPTLASIGALLRLRLQEEGASGVQTRKVFTTFMEMAQNILHYAAVDSSGEGPEGRYGSLSVARSDQGCLVMCGNDMPSAEVPRVRARLESVQGMEPDQARQAYRRRLASDQADPDSKGAGLGLLTMVVSAKAPIEFGFVPDPPPTDGLTFLFLKALI